MTETITLKLISTVGELSECVITLPKKPPWFIGFSSDKLGDKAFYDDDLFDCLCQLRKFLEEKGDKILCNGARIDAYPSTLSREMSGGRKVYIIKMGEKAKLENLVRTFDPAPPDRIGSVEEQLAYYKRWTESAV